MDAPDDAGDDPYAVLGLAPDADAAALRRAYRRLALRLHPDKDPSAAAAFARLQAAWAALG